jgi:hypothetical protein
MMDYIKLLKEQFNNKIELKEKRPGIMQLYAPLYHEDGDMVDIFLEPLNGGQGLVRICDYGMTLQRLSYTYDIDTPNKEKIFQKMISENRISENNGNLYIEVNAEKLYPAVLQFAQTVAKVSNMQYFRREVLQSLFYEMMAEYIEKELAKFNPRERAYPISTRDDLEVDWQFDVRSHQIFLFAVKDYTKARLVTIACLEFQKARVPFKSFVVHEDFENLGKKDRSRITSAADKQFISFEDFKENALQTFERETAT